MTPRVYKVVAALAVNLVIAAGAVTTGHAVGLQKLVFTQDPSAAGCAGNLTGGTAWPSGCEPIVEVQDAVTSAVITSSTDSITISVTSGTGTSGASLGCPNSAGATKLASAGVVTFTSCAIDKAGSGYTLTAVDNTNMSPTTTNGTSGSFAITAGPATQLSVTGLATSTAGVSQSVTVTAEDAGGNTATGYGGTVHFSSTDGQAVLPGDSTLTSGTKTFSSGVTLKTAGSQTVTATDTVTNTITGSQGVTVNPAAASKLSVTAPSTATAGSQFNVTVTAQDPFNNTATAYAGTVHFTSTDAKAVLPADSTLTNGTGTFPVTLKTAGAQTVTGTDKTTSSITGTSGSITVSPGAGQLVFTASPDNPDLVTNGGFETGDLSAWTAGSTLAAPVPVNSTAQAYSGSHSALLGTISAPEPAGNSTLQQNVSVPSSGTAVLSFLYWPQTTATNSSTDFQQATVICGSCSAANNTKTIFKTLSNAQTWTPAQIDLSYAGGKTVTVIFQVTQAGGTTPTAMYVDAVALSTAAAGSTLTTNPTVQVQDAFGNLINSSAMITLGIQPGSGTAGAALTCASNTVQATAGTAHFSGCSIDTTGYFYELQATASGLANGSSVPFSTPGAIVTFSQEPTSSTGGIAFPTQPVVQSTVNGESVTLAITSGTGAAGAILTCTGGNSLTATTGTASFSGCAIDKASGNAYTLTATGTSGGTHAYPAVSTPLTITVGPTAKLGLSGLANPTTAGSTQSITVTPEDAGGNATSGYTGTIHFTSSDPSAVLPADAAWSSPGTFSPVTLKTAGHQTVTATDTHTSSITGSQGVVVDATSATTLVVTAPSSATAGTPFNVGVTAEDAFGNTATGYTGTVTFRSSDAQATLPANSTLTNGTGTFPVTLGTGGPQTVTATDTVDSSITGTSGSITVNPGPATSFNVGAPGLATAGTQFGFTVTAIDNYGNVATGYAGTVTFQSTDAQATLPANSTLTNGTGAFNATLRTAGDQAVGATDTVNSTITGVSGPIRVSPAGLHSLSIAPQNATTPPGSWVAFTTTGTDAYGNSLGDVTAQTTFTIGPGGVCKRSNGTTSGPGNNLCGSSTNGTYTVTGSNSGAVTNTQLTVDPGWAKLPGSALDVAAWNSNMDVIGTNATGGGEGIYRWNGSGWTAYPGGGVRIGVGPSGNPVVVNSSGGIYRWTGSFWQPLPGSAHDVAVGGSSSDQIFVIGTNAVGGDGYGIYHWVNGGWQAFPGAGVRIAVGGDGNPTIVNASGGIWHWNGGAWQQLPGAAHDVGVGSNGAIWVTGVNAVPNGYGVYQWTPGGFSAVPGAGVNISVGSGGLPLVNNTSDDIYDRL